MIYILSPNIQEYIHVYSFIYAFIYHNNKTINLFSKQDKSNESLPVLFKKLEKLSMDLRDAFFILWDEFGKGL